MDGFKLDIHLLREIMPWAFTGGAGVLGRLMFHAKQVQRGQRKPFSWTMLWDIPIALGMGWISLGLGTWLNLQWEVTFSLALSIAYLGPYTIDRLFALYADGWKKEPTSGEA